MQQTLNFIKQLCSKLCANSFENTESACLSHGKNISQNAISSTLFKIDLKIKLENFCQTHKNRFWILYYREVEKKIGFACLSCHAQADKCRDYVLNRIVKHIKAFDVSRESLVFESVRQCLDSSERTAQGTPEIVSHYVQKIEKNYSVKSFDTQSAVALLENALHSYDDEEVREKVYRALDGYKVYGVNVILKDVLAQSMKYDEKEEALIRPRVYEELLHLEKFLTYIAKPIKSRVIDFTRSKGYELLISDALDEGVGSQEERVLDDESEILHSLTSEQTLLNKLKYGFNLDNREFLEVIARLDYHESNLLDAFTPEEKLYVKLLTRYGLTNDSEYLKSFNTKAIEKSIHQKISQKRENPIADSYSKTGEEEKKEIYLKLLYTEALSSKEVAVIFGLTAKQIDKKIENSKKIMKREQ